MRKAFTLIELLVVIAIIAILAAILFPVFAQAKMAAKKTQSLSNFKQGNLAVIQYTGDYDDSIPLSDSGSINGRGWGFGRPDYVWPEVVQPYAKNWYIFRCPGDPNATDAELSIDPNTNLPIGPNNPNYYYAWGERTDLGLNYDFLSPWIQRRSNNYVGSTSVSQGRVGNPAATLMCINSIWDRNSAGKPIGGGNWVVEAPCVKDTTNTFLDPIYALTQNGSDDQWRNYGVGWAVGNQTSWLEFGGTWAWFAKQMNASYVDGHAKSLTLGKLTEGCDVRSSFRGAAYDGDKYIWDLR